jgi:hypothetical protein
MRLTGLAGLTIGTLLFLASAPLPTLASTSLEREFRFSKESFSLLRRGSETLVEVEGASRELAAGRPDLPWVAEIVEVPDGMRVTGVQVLALDTAPLADHVRMPSTVIAKPGLGPEERSAPDPEYFSASGFQPRSPVELGMQGWQRGRNLVYVEVCPVRWEASSGRLERVTSIRVRLTMEPGFEAKIPRLRVVPEWEDGYVPSRGSTLAPESAGDPRKPQPFKATQVPSLLGSPVAYVIITSDALAGEFQRLATPSASASSYATPTRAGAPSGC